MEPKESEYKNKAKNKKFNPFENAYKQNDKKEKINLNEKTININQDNDLSNSDFYLNPKNEINLNLFEFEYEKPDIYSKKKFIFNNLNLFKILIEINHFNFELNEELVDCFINLRKSLIRSDIDNNCNTKIFSNNIIKTANPKIEACKKCNFNSKDNNNTECLIKKNQEDSLFENLINLFRLICQVVININCSLFLGIIKTENEKSDKDFACYSITVNVTDYKSILKLKINDIKKEMKFIETKTEFQFKNLYLKKFCHESKNPILNILQLTKNFKQNNIKSSKDNVSFFSKNNQFSKQTSNLSNISSNLKNHKTSFKKSSKNFSELHYNKTLRNNLSSIGGDFINLTV